MAHDVPSMRSSKACVSLQEFRRYWKWLRHQIGLVQMNQLGQKTGIREFPSSPRAAIRKVEMSAPGGADRYVLDDGLRADLSAVVPGALYVAWAALVVRNMRKSSQGKLIPISLACTEYDCCPDHQRPRVLKDLAAKKNHDKEFSRCARQTSFLW